MRLYGVHRGTIKAFRSMSAYTIDDWFKPTGNINLNDIISLHELRYKYPPILPSVYIKNEQIY